MWGPLLFNIFLSYVIFVITGSNIASFVDGSTPLESVNNGIGVGGFFDPKKHQLFFFKWISELV